MKKIAFIILLSASLQVYAQNELDPKFKPIPAKKSPVKEVIPPVEAAPTVNPPAPVAPDPLQINPEELFSNPNLYKKDANVPGIFYRRNQYLGGFKTKTIVSTVRFRDAAFVDGDKIKMYVNDQLIEPEVTLDGEFKEFKIKLIDGKNKIDFEAINEGFASPNTAQFEVYDDKGTVITSSQWNVGTGYKATIILFKE
ncbi:hypothetical protein [Flavobacterium branchiicola]|uniref:Secreted protein n=1 Tax=Flavobacterium branchiicola TaxID=1114875 RepID=A0ABV9PBP4_9FLAO|nr:hypothetical protein [Flavobacterium branchiicola]MBS7253544.1 hypothetical protein [Flavobacterium branchiicola]